MYSPSIFDTSCPVDAMDWQVWNGSSYSSAYDVLMSEEHLHPLRSAHAGEMSSQAGRRLDPGSHSSSPIANGTAETTWRCVGDEANMNRSCLYRNLYFHRGHFVMYAQSRPDYFEMRVNARAKYGGLSSLAKFQESSKLDEALAANQLIEQRGLTVHFVPLYINNIGHALFDGLYP